MTTPTVIKWRTDEGVNSAIVFKRTQARLYLIPMVGFYPFRTIKIHRVPVAEEAWMTPMTRSNGQPYPVKRAARRFLKAHKQFGGTAVAKRTLKEIIAS